MVAASNSARIASISGMVSIRATEISPPLGWALMERQLIGFMEEAGDLAAQKYFRPDGTSSSMM